MMLRYRVASSPLVLALAMAAFPRGATAQYAGDPTQARAPRFLLAMAERSQPVPVDLKRSAFLRRPLSLAFDGATLKQALAEISRQAGLNLVYADDVLSAGALVNLRADRITVAAALTEVLLDAGVDVVFTPEGRATLVKRAPGLALQLGTITGTVTAAGTGAPLQRAIVSVVGTRLNRRRRVDRSGSTGRSPGHEYAGGSAGRRSRLAVAARLGPARSRRIQSQSAGRVVGSRGQGQLVRRQRRKFPAGADRRDPGQPRSTEPRRHPIDRCAERCRGVDLWRARRERCVSRHHEARKTWGAYGYVQLERRDHPFGRDDGYAQ